MFLYCFFSLKMKPTAHPSLTIVTNVTKPHQLAPFLSSAPLISLSQKTLTDTKPSPNPPTTFALKSPAT